MLHRTFCNMEQLVDVSGKDGPTTNLQDYLLDT